MLIIDGADNCAYDIFAATEKEFSVFFPADGQDVAFSDEIFARPLRRGVNKAFDNLWKRPVAKVDVQGIHGIIFYQLEFKKKHYPNRKDSDVSDHHPDGAART